MVFYRKYRPQKIADLDSEQVRSALYSIFSTKDFPHAFLFSGPKGLGKTSTARIVAKVINCEAHNKQSKFSEKEIEPDDKCIQCVSISSGTNLDVFEIDGASNRGIDEIRDLKEKINLLPTKAAKKIYIIDEVHMLTTEAFNALLKTLEEPPSHAVFILCTTELHKVPQTIISRCFRVNFVKANADEIARSLKRIVKAENIKIEEQVLLEIAKMSDGSFRDSTKILEELFYASGQKEITLKIFQDKYNTFGYEEALNGVVKSLKEKDLKKGFEIIAMLDKQGVDFKFFTEKLLDRFHEMLLAKAGVIEDKGYDFDTQQIKNAINMLLAAHQSIKYSVLPQLPLELMLTQWVGEDEVGNKSDAAPVSVVLEKKSSTNDSAIEVKTEVNKLGNDLVKEFISEVKNHNHLIAGVLRSCEFEDIGKDILTIVAISKFHKEKLDESKSMLILDEVAEKIFAKKVKISIVLRG